MVVRSLENLKKLGNDICVRENLKKSGDFTERAQNIYCTYSVLQTILFQIKTLFTSKL